MALGIADGVVLIIVGQCTKIAMTSIPGEQISPQLSRVQLVLSSRAGSPNFCEIVRCLKSGFRGPTESR